MADLSFHDKPNIFILVIHAAYASLFGSPFFLIPVL